MSKKDYQLPPIELLGQHKIHRRPAPQYNYILLENNSPDKCETTVGNQKVKPGYNSEKSSLDRIEVKAFTVKEV